MEVVVAVITTVEVVDLDNTITSSISITIKLQCKCSSNSSQVTTIRATSREDPRAPAITTTNRCKRTGTTSTSNLHNSLAAAATTKVAIKEVRTEVSKSPSSTLQNLVARYHPTSHNSSILKQVEATLM